MKRIFSYFTIFFLNVTIFTPMQGAAPSSLTTRELTTTPAISHQEINARMAEHRDSVIELEKHMATFQIPTLATPEPEEHSDFYVHIKELEASLLEMGRRRSVILDSNPASLEEGSPDSKPRRPNARIKACLPPTEFLTVHGFGETSSNEASFNTQEASDLQHSGQEELLKPTTMAQKHVNDQAPREPSRGSSPLEIHSASDSESTPKITTPERLQQTSFSAITAAKAIGAVGAVATCVAVYQNNQKKSLDLDADLIRPQKRFYVPGMETVATKLIGFGLNSLASLATTTAGIVALGYLGYTIRSSFRDWMHYQCKQREEQLKAENEAKKKEYAGAYNAVRLDTNKALQQIAALEKILQAEAARTDTNFHALEDDTTKKFQTVTRCIQGIQRQNISQQEQLNTHASTINQVGQGLHERQKTIVTGLKSLIDLVALIPGTTQTKIMELTEKIEAASQQVEGQKIKPLDDKVQPVAQPAELATELAAVNKPPVLQKVAQDKVPTNGSCCSCA